MAGANEMYPRLVVSTTDEEFAALWPVLAEACGISLVTNESPALANDITLTATPHGVASAGRHFSLPKDQDRLASWIRNQIDKFRARQARESFAAGERTKYRFEDIVGIPNVLASAALLMPLPGAPVILTGETGTGKTLLARAIHYEGPRHAAPFVEVDCTQTSARALFGNDRQPGLLDLAAGGTLVLNTVTNLSDALLGAIADGGFDVRTIATSRVTLSTTLCRRLGAEPIALPPLRARRNEIAPLTVSFIQRFGADHTDRISLNYAELEARDWPGNVRELKTVVERTLLLSAKPTVTLDHFT
jgi:DNA-binding NtrC family response regulator